MRYSLFSHLRVKITLPYLLLAVISAIVITYTTTQLVARDLEDRFTRSLVDSGRLAADTLVKIERDHLALERAIAHTESLPQAVADHNTGAIQSLILPLAVNARADLVDVVDPKGVAVLLMHHRLDSDNPNEYLFEPGTNYGDWKIVQRVAAGESDASGDKFVDLVSTPWGMALYTAGPIKVDDQVVGVLLVGSYLESIARRLDLDSLSNVTIYSPDGRVLSSTLTTREPERANMTADQAREIAQASTDRVYIRPTLAGYGTRPYDEAFGLFQVRKGEPLGLFSVASSREEYVTQSGSELRVSMVAIFSAGIVIIILIGVFVAGSIVRPVTALVSASRRVAEGNLDTHVQVRGYDELGVLARAFNRMVDGLREREFLKDLFGRVVSREVGENLLANYGKGGIKLGGEMRVVTMLFTDIRDFTSISERYDPGEVVSLLNEYFTAMLEVISQYHGMVNKFGGDSTLVIFGAPVPQPDHARRAVECAIALRKRLREFNERRRERGFEQLGIGIGINTGQVIAGQIGSPGRFEYTVIGDAVNVTSRIEGLTRDLPGRDILISEATYRALGSEWEAPAQDLGWVRVKGKQAKVRVYAVLDDRAVEPASVIGAPAAVEGVSA